MLTGFLKLFWPLSALTELTKISGELYEKKRQLVELGHCGLY